MCMCMCVYVCQKEKNYMTNRSMDTATRVQILDETDCISHSTNSLGKGMNPIILPQLWVNSRAD